MEKGGVLRSDSNISMSNSDSESDGDSRSANEVDEGSSLPAEEIGCVRYREVSLYALPNRIPVAPNILTAKVTLSYTKEVQRKSQSLAYVSPVSKYKITY